MPMKTAQGEAGEDVRMLQQGRNMNAGDPQLQSQQAEADAASLGKDVGNAVFQRQGLDSVTKQYGPDSNEAKDATTVYNREVLKNQAPKPTDIAGLRGDFMQQTKDFNVTRDFYRQVEQVLHTGGPNAMGDISFITAMAKILDPGSVVRPSESGQIEVNSRTMPESIKLYLSNLINDPKLLTAGSASRPLVNTVRQAYVSRLQSVDQLKRAYSQSAGQHQFPRCQYRRRRRRRPIRRHRLSLLARSPSHDGRRCRPRPTVPNKAATGPRAHAPASSRALTPSPKWPNERVRRPQTAANWRRTRDAPAGASACHTRPTGAMPPPSPTSFAPPMDVIRRVAFENQVPPEDIYGIAKTESGF